MKWTFPICVLALLSCEGEHVRESQEIRATLEQALRAFNAGDVEAYLKFHTAGAMVFAPGRAPEAGIDSLRESDRKLFDRFRIDEKRTVDEIKMGDGWAWVRGAYQSTLTSKSDGAILRDSGHYMEVLIKEGGTWKYARTMWNNDGAR